MSKYQDRTICEKQKSEIIAILYKIIPHEDFLGFHQLRNIGADTISSAIKDNLQPFGLSLDNCRGQCFNGAANMFGEKSGVAKQITDIQQKSHATHCYTHSLNLGVDDMVMNNKLLADTLNTVRELVNLIKYSPMRDNLLREIKQHLEEANDKDITDYWNPSVMSNEMDGTCSMLSFSTNN